MATPFAIQMSDDDSTLVVSAAGSDELFTVDANSGEVLGRVRVGAVPRGIALESAAGKPSRAWILNAVANTVSLVDVSDTAKPKVIDTVTMKDPTHPEVKRGRVAFNTASASTTATFSCASCHPDGHTDQLLWVLKTPIVTGGNQIMPRSTMPIRGLRDTAPFHWDGIPGDPYGGINSASIRKSVEPNSRLDDPASAARHLIDGGLAATMSLVGDKTVNDEGKTQVITAASNRIRSYDLKTGEIIWQCGGLTGNVTPCPVVEGDVVYCMSGYQGHSLLALPLTERGDLSRSDKPRALDSALFPLRFQLEPGESRPKVKVTHHETGEVWVV